MLKNFDPTKEPPRASTMREEDTMVGLALALGALIGLCVGLTLGLLLAALLF